MGQRRREGGREGGSEGREEQVGKRSVFQSMEVAP